MTWVDPALVHEPAAGRAVPAAWGNTVRDDLEFLVHPPACSVFSAVAQQVSPSAFGEPMGTTLAAPNKRFDTAGMHGVEDTSRVTILTPGRYQIAVAVDFAAGNPAGYRVILDLLVNGSQIVNGDTRFFAANTAQHGVRAARTLQLAARDSVQVMVQHNAGGDRGVTLQEFTVILASVL